MFAVKVATHQRPQGALKYPGSARPTERRKVTLNARTFLKACVMNAMADDYEQLDHIVDWATKLLKQRGIEASHKEIVDALAQLIEEENARAYKPSPRSPYSKPVRFSVSQASELWFYLRPKGLAKVKNTGELGCQPPKT